MIIEGSSRGDAQGLASHLLKTENERVKVLEIRGLFFDTVPSALQEIEEHALLTRCAKPLYHAHIDWKRDERLTEAQQLQAIDVLEQELGLTGQPRVVVQHVKRGREHVHVVFSRIDLDRNVAISDSHNYRNHELAARQLERTFGLERVQGPHIERGDRPRPERGFEKWEFQQAKHSGGLDPRDFRQVIRLAWQQADNGSSLTHALAEHGMVLGNGDRRDCVVVIDRQGDYLALNTKTVGARAQDIRAKLANLDRSQLPSIEQARQMQQSVERIEAPGQSAVGGGNAMPRLEESPRDRIAVVLMGEFVSPQQSPLGGGVIMDRHPVEQTFDAFQNTVGALFDVLMPGASPGNPSETVYQDRAYNDSVAAAMRRAEEQRPAQPEPERDFAAERATQERTLSDSPRVEAQPTAEHRAVAEDAHALEHAASLTRQQVTSAAIAAAATAPDQRTLSDADYIRQQQQQAFFESQLRDQQEHELGLGLGLTR